MASDDNPKNFEIGIDIEPSRYRFYVSITLSPALITAFLTILRMNGLL